jgi:uncharacterized protein
MSSFTPISALFGGALIGLSASVMLLFAGRIAGVSGIFGGLFARRDRDGRAWRACFLGGLVAGGLLMAFLRPTSFATLPRSVAAELAAGLLVGFGASMANGCTSGHGVCGVGRLAPRSLVATITFMLSGAVTVYVVRHLVGA